jgi:hypothetical protein
VTGEKPSRNEEEYFAKREAELLRASRERAALEAKQAERRSHYMKCPKCGADLTAEDYHGVQVDRCPECKGVWFDAGETEALMSRESGGAMTILKSIIRGVGT